MASEWWGFSKEHGWVVLDRTVPSNAPGLRDSLTFFRFRDACEFVEKRKDWNPPLYRYAANYLADLAGDAAVMAAAELEAVKAQWPDLQREVQRRHREELERLEAARVEEEKARKKAVRASRKQAPAAAATGESAAAADATEQTEGTADSDSEGDGSNLRAARA